MTILVLRHSTPMLRRATAVGSPDFVAPEASGLCPVNRPDISFAMIFLHSGKIEKSCFFVFEDHCTCTCMNIRNHIILQTPHSIVFSGASRSL